MERVYAFGVDCIQYIQYWFKDSEEYFAFMNKISNPHHAFELIFPFIATFDSVFAAQFLLCISFGSWLNTVMKWWLLEDRPYWWVRETTFYQGLRRPRLQQFTQTCETGPGCPSGHTSMMAMQLVLYLMWISHFMNDRNCYVWWWKYLVYPVFCVALVSVMVARMFVASHFPHQCLLGALVGLFVAPALCIYVSDPYIWGYGGGSPSTHRSIFWHVLSVLVIGSISIFTYFSLKLCGVDPEWSITLAHRWCNDPDSINVTSLPLYSLVQAAASLLAWSIAVTPDVASYRHYTQRRSLILATITTACIMYITKDTLKHLDKDNEGTFYIVLFVVYVLRSVLLLRLVPGVAMWPYGVVNMEKKKV